MGAAWGGVTPGARDPTARDPGARDPTARNRGARDPTARDPVALKLSAHGATARHDGGGSRRCRHRPSNHAARGR